MNWDKIGDIFAYMVVLMYFGAGGYIIFEPGFKYIPQTIRVIFGSFLFLYGLYRLVRIIYKDRE
jgi:hypothetical protein